MFVSVALAGALAWVVYGALPDELDVRTDIVGYPTFANFNINGYVWAYGLTVVLLPLVALALYLVLTRAFVGPQGPRGPIPRPLGCVEPVPVATGWKELGVSTSRTLLVGTVLAFEVATTAADHEKLGFAVTTLGYGLVVGVSAWLAAHLARRDPIGVVSSVNTFAAPIVVLALYGVSESTEVAVSATSAVHEYPWLPAWLALGVTGTLLLWLGLASIRCSGRVERIALERRALLLVVAPLGLFLFVASLPGALGTVDFFEEGQFLAGSELIQQGAFPWRDLLMAHGVLHDVAGGLVGAEVFEDSRWGVVAGQTLLLEPFAWVAVYYLCSYLFGANWLFLLATQLLIVTGHISSIHIRFSLLPFVLLVLVALFRRPTVARAAAFTSLLALQVIVTPEALTAAVAYIGTLVLFEIYYYERGRGLAAGFRRGWLCLASGVVIMAGWALFLVANGALDDWVFSFTTFIPGHLLTGGIPLLVSKTQFEFVAPVVLVLAVFCFLVAWTRMRRPLAFHDWAMVAMAALTFLYYSKFLSRADRFHLDHSFSVAVPLLFYIVYRGVTFGEAGLVRIARARGALWVPARHTLTAPLLLILLVSAPVALPDAARAVPSNFAAVAPRDPEVARIGFDRLGENDPRMIRDLSRTTTSLLEPGDTLFDFTNAPGLFHYLLDLSPSTRYYHVSLAIRQRTQADLVRLLEKSRPDIVVLTSDGDGRSLPTWDGVANQVRHYDVSEYLLDNYVPVLDSHGFVLMRRRENGVRADPELYFRVDACDWGYVPNFFAPSPSTLSKAVSLPISRTEDPNRVAVKLPADAAEYGWLELRTGEPLAEGRFELNDRYAGNGRRSITFKTLERGQTSVRVKVGACSQWRGYRPGTLYLSSSVMQDVREMTLLR